MSAPKKILFIVIGVCILAATVASSQIKNEHNVKDDLNPNGTSIYQDKSRSREFLYKKYDLSPLKIDESEGWSHTPYFLGKCDVCHVSNNIEKPGELKMPARELCLSCHESVMWKKNVHRPVGEDCNNCHNAHNSQNRFLLHEPTKSLCIGCHIGIKEVMDESTVQHDPVFKGNTCKNCHSPHSSDYQYFLKGRAVNVCMMCHGKKDVRDDTGHKLANIQKILQDNYYSHIPMGKRNCSTCHAVHGSQHYRLLLAEYPFEFYAAYEENKTYKLCLSCHQDEKRFTQMYTRTHTNFRNGNLNLHAVHVKEPDEGRTCRACHLEHAAPHQHLMRRQVPFGDAGWLLEINYMPVENGGYCGRTCHEYREYKH